MSDFVFSEIVCKWNPAQFLCCAKLSNMKIQFKTFGGQVKKAKPMTKKPTAIKTGLSKRNNKQKNIEIRPVYNF